MIKGLFKVCRNLVIVLYNIFLIFGIEMKYFVVDSRRYKISSKNIKKALEMYAIINLQIFYFRQMFKFMALDKIPHLLANVSLNSIK